MNSTGGRGLCAVARQLSTGLCTSVHLVNMILTTFVSGYLFKSVRVVKIDCLSAGHICLLTNMIKIMWHLCPLRKDWACLLIVHLKVWGFLNLEFLTLTQTSLWAESATPCLCICPAHPGKGNWCEHEAWPSHYALGERILCVWCRVSGLLPVSMELRHTNLLTCNQGNSRPFTTLTNTKAANTSVHV